MYLLILEQSSDNSKAMRTISREGSPNGENPQRLHAERLQIITGISRRFEHDDIVRSSWRHEVNTKIDNQYKKLITLKNATS